jgi:hypothetical protein
MKKLREYKASRQLPQIAATSTTVHKGTALETGYGAGPLTVCAAPELLDNSHTTMLTSVLLEAQPVYITVPA